MAKKNELEKIIAGLRQCMLVEGTTVEVFRVFEILAEEDGEIDDVLDEYPSIKEEDLRKTFDDLATCFEDICAQMQQSKPQKAKQPRAAIAPDKRNDEVRINIDGAAQGNPGPASIGVVFTDSQNYPFSEISKRIGSTTNNVAEYTALIEAMKRALELGCENISVFSDSQLMVRQVKGIYKTKNLRLKKLLEQVRELKSQFAKFEITHVPREENKRADALANLAFKRR